MLEGIVRAYGLVEGELFDLFGPLLAAAGNGDGRTVHVHFTITNLVEPGPGKRVVTGCDAVGDSVLEGGRIKSTCVLADIPCRRGRASTFNGVDDHPLTVLCWLHVLCQRNLTRTAAMSSATLELKGLLGANRHSRSGLGWPEDVRPVIFAREVGPICQEWRVVEGVGAERRWIHHLHMSRSRREDSRGREEDS